MLPSATERRKPSLKGSSEVGKSETGCGEAASQAPFISEKLIRFHHCDPAGIVFYPQYFVLFHELLEDWFNRGLGIDYADFVSRERRGLPTAHIDCDFKVPSKIGDTVQMQLGVKRVGRTSLALSVKVCAGEEVRVTANQVLVLISLADGALVPIPDDLRARFERFAEA
jgi:4-hydroxybenzoyl-CoA thioesterase